MKKLLSLVLVLAVVLSSMSFAFAAAPSDISGDKYESSISKLISLGILGGYPDGTFKPTNNITRAEFAKVLVYSLGYKDAAEAAGPAKFSDAVGHWAVGPINVASTLGIVNGRGAGKFDPDANVTFEEAVTMIVRSLGYEPAAKANGGFPVGYLTIASQEKITKDVPVTSNQPANRATVAKLLDQSLEVIWLVQKGYGTMTTFEKPTKLIADPANPNASKTVFDDDYTILAKGLKLKKASADVDSYDTTKKTISFKQEVDDVRTLTYVDPIDPTNTKNCNVTVWTKDDVIYSFANDTTVKADVLEKIDGTDSQTSSDVTDGSLYKLKLKLDGGEFYVKGYNVVSGAGTWSASNADLFFNDATNNSTIPNLIGKLAKVYIKDSKIIRVEAFNVGTPALIAEATDKKIKYQKYNDNDQYFSNLDLASDLLYVFVDGKAKTLADLKAGMYFEKWSSSNGKKVVIAATTKTATGKLASFSKDKVVIGSTSYDTGASIDNVAAPSGAEYVSINDGTKYEKAKADDLAGIEVTGYLNLQGKVAFLKGKSTSSTSDFYALVKSIAIEGKSLTIVKDVDGTSTEVTYPVKTDSDDLKNVNDDVTGNNETGPADAGVNTDTDYTDARIGWADVKSAAHLNTTTGKDFDTAADYTLYTDATNPDSDGNAYFARIFKITINSDNKVTKIERVAATNYGTLGKLDKDNDYIDLVAPATNRKYVDGAKFFDLKENKVRYWKDLEDRAPNGATVATAAKASSANGLDVVAFYGATSYSNIISDDLFYAFVTAEGYDGTYYNITTSDGTALKLHKDDVAAGSKQMDKQILIYTKDGEKIKVKGVSEAVYTAPNVVARNVIAGSTPKSTQTYASATFIKVDGDDVQFTYTGATNATYTNGITYWEKMDSAVKVIRSTFKSGTPGAIDDASASTKTDITGGDKIALVIVDGKVRAIYYYK